MFLLVLGLDIHFFKERSVHLGQDFRHLFFYLDKLLARLEPLGVALCNNFIEVL